MYENFSLAVISRLGEDSIQLYLPSEGYTLFQEISLPPGSNPQDIAFVSSQEVWISLYNAPYLFRYDLFRRKELPSFSLSSFQDRDIYPESSLMEFYGGKLYVAIQRLDRGNSTYIWPPTDISYLLEIDPFNFSLISYSLLFSNPIQMYREGDFLYIVCPSFYAYNYALDGGVIRFSLISKNQEVLLEESQIGYEVADYLSLGNGRALVILSDSSLQSYLYVYREDTKVLEKLLGFLSSSSGGFFSSLLRVGDRVYIGNRKLSSPSLWVYSISRNAIEEEIFLSSLPPLDLVWIP